MIIKFKKFLNEYILNQVLSLDKLKEKYPKMIFTIEPHIKFKNTYSAKAEIETKDGKIEYVAELKGPISEERAIKFLNLVADKNYNKYY